MKVYLLSGKAGSGKNYIANLLKKKLNNSLVTSLSKYIKLYAFELSLWDGDDNNKPRKFLQETGDLLRAIDLNFLTKRMLEDIKVYAKLGLENIIISDVRLLDEIKYLKSNLSDVTTIRINNIHSTRKLTDQEKKHITETNLDNYQDFDYIIDNNDNLEEIIMNILEGR